MGPVFVFFGQPDGVEPIPDPLGHAVKVPENGLIKLRASVEEAIPSNEGATVILPFLALAKSGVKRRASIFALG